MVISFVAAAGFFVIPKVWPNNGMLAEQVLIILVGILFANWANDWGNPRLVVEVTDAIDMKDPNDGRPLKHMYLSVTNKPYGLYLSRRKSANNCRGTITVKRRSDETIVFENMPLRWAGNPSPLRVEPAEDGAFRWVPDESLRRSSQFTTLPVEGPEKFDVVLRFSDSVLAIGWNHESYDYIDARSKQKNYRIEAAGEYIVEVRLRSDEDSYPTQEFILINSASYEDVKMVKRDY